MGNDIYEIKERLCMELAEINNNMKKSGGLDPNTLDIIDKLTHAMKSIATIIAMDEANQGSYYDRGYGNNYGRNQSRNSMGQYNAGYPQYSAGRMYGHDEGAMNDIRTLMNSTTDERTRQGLSNLLNTMSR